MKRYYFDSHNLDSKYATLWNGYLEYNKNDMKINIEYISQLNDLITDICDVNFYVNDIDNKIYISLCQDSHYYYHQFEKDIKKLIIEIENKFSINIFYGEFNATEVKHQGNQYKYTITKDENLKIILKKKTLNWDNYESKNKKIKKIDKDNIDNINNIKNLNNLKI
jgi:hypothetical protein